MDSTYYLWKWLQENPKDKILVHHCLFLKRRLKEEKEATDNILAYLRSQKLTNFKYVETGMQKGNLGGRTLDVEMLSGMAAIVVKCHPSVKTVLLPYCREECSALHGHVLKAGGFEGFDDGHRYSVVNRVMETLTKRSFDYVIYKGSDGGLLSKKEMIHTMPKELFGMTWYCRRPRKGRPCSNCHTCRKVARALKK